MAYLTGVQVAISGALWPFLLNAADAKVCSLISLGTVFRYILVRFVFFLGCTALHCTVNWVV
jgi:hypothetical protein